MAIKLIASDLDGTIIDEHNFISPSNLNAIKDINTKKINFAVCTGKSYSIGKSLCNNFNATYEVKEDSKKIVNELKKAAKKSGLNFVLFPKIKTKLAHII